MIVGALEIQMMADLAQLRKDMSAANESLDKTARAAETAANMIKSSLAGVSAAMLVKEFISMADSVASMDARLKLATKTQEDFNTARQAAYDISQRNLTSIDSTAKVISRLNPIVEKMGGNINYTTAVSEALGAALRVSGASTQEASSVMIQFSQAMSSGALRGEEFNSISENGSRVMDALSNQLGKGRGELRAMAADGKLTADVVGNALVKELQKLKAEAAAMPLTVSGAWQRMQNDLALYVDGVNKAYGVTKIITDVMEFFRKNLDGVTSALSTGIAVAAAYFGIYYGIPAVLSAVVGGFNALMLMLAHVATGGVIASGAINTLTTSILAANSATFTLIGTVTKMQVVLGALFAAFAGWEIGEWARKNFLEVELFGIAMVNGLLKGWEHLKYGFQVAVEAISYIWDKTLSGLGGALTWFLDKFSAGLEALGLDEAAKKVAKWAASVRDSTRDTSTWTERLAGLNVEHDRAIKQIDDVTGEMADQAIAARQVAQAVAAQVEPLKAAAKATNDKKEADKAAKEHAKALKETLNDVDKAVKDLRDDIVKEVEAVLKANEAAQEIIEKIEFETAALQMSNTEREIAIKLRELEKTGIEKGTQAYEDYAKQIREAVLKKAEVEESIKLAKTQTDEIKKMSEEVGTSLTDSLFRAMERGESMWKALWDGIQNSVKTTVLKIMIKPVQQGITDLLGQAMGGFSGPGGFMGGLENLGSMLSGGWDKLTGIPGSLGLDFVNSSIGQYLGLSGTQIIGGNPIVGPTGAGSSFLGGLDMLGNGMGYLNALNAAANGKWGSAIGSGVGTFFGGPVGGAIGNFLGSAVDSLFGGDGKDYFGADWMASSKRGGFRPGEYQVGDRQYGWSITGARSSELESTLKAVTETSVGMLDGLQKTFGGIADFTVGTYFSHNSEIGQGNIKVMRDGQTLTSTSSGAYGSDPKQAFQNYTNELAGAVKGAIDTIALPEWAKAQIEKLGTGITIEQLTAAVSGIIATRNAITAMTQAMNPMGGIFTDIAHSSESAIVGLAGLAGGMDALLAKTKQFVSDYYSEQEKAALQARQVVDKLKELGFGNLQIASKEEFRALVESLGSKLEDATAQKQLVGLLDLGPQFAELSGYLKENNTTLGDLAAQAPAVTALQTFNDKQAQYQETMDRSATAAEQTTVAVEEGFATLGEQFTDGIAYMNGTFMDMTKLFKGWDNGDSLNVNVVTA